MKLRAPRGVGDPCVAGVRLLPRDGLYEVEAEIGALLVECFGFVAVASQPEQKNRVVGAPRRGRAASKKVAVED